MLTEIVCIRVFSESDNNHPNHRYENLILYETYLYSLYFSNYYIFNKNEIYLGNILSEDEFNLHFITTAEYRKQKIKRFLM